MRVLIVDDNAMNRKLLRAILVTDGHSVIDAEHGIAALETLEREKIDAVISDILMPQMDGYRLCYEMRKNQQLKAIPFIAYTATYTSSSDEQVALNFGADKFIRKPAPADTILHALHEAVKSVSGRTKKLGEPQELLAMREYSEALVRKLEESNQELDARHRELQTLYQFSQKILNTLDLQKILEEFLEKTLSVGPFDLGVIRLLDPTNKSLQVAATRGYLDNKNISYLTIDLTQESIGNNLSQVISKRKTLIAENLAESEGWSSFKREGVQSAIMFPISTDEQILGIMQLGSRRRQKIQSSETSLLEALASQAGIAIQKARLYEQTQRNLERIRALHEIDNAISSTLELRTVLSVLLQKIELFLPIAAATTVRLLNRETGELESLACRGLDEHEWRSLQQTMLSGRARRIVEMKAPAVVRDIRETFNPTIFDKHGLISYLGVPLIAKETILGVLGLYTKKEHEFTTEEIEFLVTLAGQAAIAIHNAQLFEEVALARKELETTNRFLGRSLKELGSLNTALIPIATGVSAQEMMSGIIDRLLDATGADAALIRVWDKKADRYPIASQRNFPEEYLQRVESAPSGGAAEWVIKHGEAIIAPDIAAESRFKGKMQLQLGLRSCAMLPLKVHDDVRGVMHIASRELGYFDKGQTDHLLVIARQMGIALDNRELFYDLKSSRDELERANKVKDEFLSVVSHELRTPVNLIAGYTNLLTEGAVKQEEGLKTISRASNDLSAMVDSILYATSLEANQVIVERQEFNIDRLLAEVRGNSEANLPKDITLAWNYPGDLPLIKTDRKKLKQVLNNLINNAIKFTEHGEVTISVRLVQRKTSDAGTGPELAADEMRSRSNSKAEQWAEFQIADTGIGIPTESLANIFNKFYQVDSSKTRAFGGVGLGLYVAKKFTDLLAGTIEVESEPGKGSRFTVKIPTQLMSVNRGNVSLRRDPNEVPREIE